MTDTILFNGRIATLDPANPSATAVAIESGLFAAVGTDQEIMARRDPKTVVIDLNGRTVIPGLNDSHTHLIRGGLNYNMELRWDGVASLADALRMLRNQARRTPAPQWVRVVGGWSEFQFAERRMPTLAEVNAAAPDTPVFVLHLYARAMLNAAALRAVGYTKDTPEPAGGTIERDAQSNPTGMLIAKPNAMILYATLGKGPKLPFEYQLNSTRHFMRELNRLGITSVIDAGGGSQNYPDDYEVVERLHRDGELTVRIAYNLFTQKPKGELADFQGWTSRVKPGDGDAMYRHIEGVTMLHLKRIGLFTALLSVSACALAQDEVAQGQKQFEAQCAGCHTVKPGVNGFGPSLAGVVGKAAGKAPGYTYTAAMANSGLTWDERTLDAFLTSTTQKVPGTSMPVALPDAHVRSAIIAYLKSVSATMAAAAPPAAAAVAIKPSGGPTQDELTHAASSARDWLYASKDYAGQRFVKLSEINTKNAHDLRPVCIYRSDSATPTQTNPLVYRGIMYLTVDSSIVAIDAATCRQRWSYKWDAKGRVLSPTNRGVGIKDGVLVRGTADGYLIALDMDQGRLLWSRQIASADSSQYLSMPPLMFEDLVIYGPAGADWGAKNWIGAFRLATGEPVWRFNLIPDDNEPGADSWKDPKARTHGGGSLWTPLAFDVNQGILYLPVGNPSPDFYGAVREGDNLYTNSVVALDVRSGKLLWYRQFISNDVHDADLSQVSPIFSGTVGGKSRKLISVSGKDGLLHVLDRDTHETLYELPITTRTNVDSQPTVEGVHRCPGLLGGMEWNGPAYNPLSKTLYVAAVDWCGTFTRSADKPEFTPYAHYYGGNVVPDPKEQARGWLTAIDSVTGKVRWKKQWPTPLVAAVTATSGGVLFTGDLNNNFLVLDGSDGKTLYRFNTGGTVGGGVLSYELGGKQYVATTSGVVSGFFGGSGTSSIVVFALH